MKLRTPLEYVSAIRLVRPYAKGFTAKDGYDIRKLNRIVPKYALDITDRTPTGKLFKRARKTVFPEIAKILSYSKRKKLQRYFDVVNFNMAEPHIVKRPRNKKRLRSLQEFSQHEDYPKDLKVAFLPVALDAQKTKLVWKGDILKKVIQDGITRYTINFDKKRFVSDPKAEIEFALSQTPATRFMVQAGKHVIWQKGGTKNEIMDELLHLQQKYGDERCDPNDSNSHHFENWLNGVIGFEAQSGDQWDIRNFWVEYRGERRTELEHREIMRQLLKSIETAKFSSTNIHKSASYRKSKKEIAKRLQRERMMRQVNYVRAKKGEEPMTFD